MKSNKNEELSIDKKIMDKKTAERKLEDKKDKGKKNTSLRLDKKTLKELKLIAIEEETSVQKLIENLISDFISQRRRSEK